jgi:hypothetical protein
MIILHEWFLKKIKKVEMVLLAKTLRRRGRGGVFVNITANIGIFFNFQD